MPAGLYHFTRSDNFIEGLTQVNQKIYLLGKPTVVFLKRLLN